MEYEVTHPQWRARVRAAELDRFDLDVETFFATPNGRRCCRR